MLTNGAIGISSANAQVRPDSVRTDTLRRPGAPVDSTRPAVTLLDSAAQRRAQRRIDSIADFRRGDTIKAPFPKFETPPSFEIDDRIRFNREQILSSEATNIVELLDRVPGVISYRTGWLASAHVASYLGDFSRIRVFMDGVEVDDVNPRSNRVLDYSDVYLWALDEVVIERAAGEVRVWCRTSTQNRTTPYTRTDVFTGDLNTNGFRGLFGRRFMNGMALQVMGQQFATQQGRSSAFGTTGSEGRGDGANQTLISRFGWSKAKWSADVYGVVTTRDRDEQFGVDSTPPVAQFKGARREGYLRLAYNDTSNGFWSQVMLNSLRFRLEGIRDPEEEDTLVRSDTTRSREQKVFAVGYRTNSWQASFTERLRTFNGRAWHAPAVRAAYQNKLFSAGVFLENAPLDSSRHGDVQVKVVPFPWLALTAAYSRRQFDDSTARDDETVARVEGGVHWKSWWFTGGAIRQSPILQMPPSLIVGPLVRGTANDSLLVRSTGILFGARGTIYKEVRIDVQGTRWSNDLLFYRPRFAVRTDLSLTTNWLSRFPKGQFGFNAHLINEYRDPIDFPYLDPEDDSRPVIRSLVSRVTTALVEIRLQRAVVFYQFHNVSGQPYEYVPGIAMPRQVQMYGVRWEFWN